MHPSPNRRRHQRQINLLERLDRLLIALDLLPFRDKPVSSGFAGSARRTLAEADRLLGLAVPTLAESTRQPGEILRAALLNSTRLNGQIRQDQQAFRRKMGQSYPRTLPGV